MPTQTAQMKPIVEEGIRTPEKIRQFVVFALGGEEYGVNIRDVREIVRTGEVTMVPNAPNFIRGIINLRGKIVVVIDLEKRFLLQREEEYTGKHIIIAEIGESIYGMMVDEVTEVLRLPAEDIKPAPPIITKKINVDYLMGVGTVEERLLILLDLLKVLAEEELVELSEVGGKHYRKIKTKKVEEEVKEEKPVEEVKPEEVKPEEAKPEEVKPEEVEEAKPEVRPEVKPEKPKEVKEVKLKEEKVEAKPAVAKKVEKKPEVKPTKPKITAKKTVEKKK